MYVCCTISDFYSLFLCEYIEQITITRLLINRRSLCFFLSIVHLNAFAMRFFLACIFFSMCVCVIILFLWIDFWMYLKSKEGNFFSDFVFGKKNSVGQKFRESEREREECVMQRYWLVISILYFIYIAIQCVHAAGLIAYILSSTKFTGS